MSVNNRPDSRSAGETRESGRGVRRGVLSSKRGIFLVGLGSGALLAYNWRALFKEGVKVAVNSGAKVQKAVTRGAENIADVTREAVAELQSDKPTG